MIGKKNIIFGFLYLVATAALGPYMVIDKLPDEQSAMLEKQKDVGRLQALKTNSFEEELEPLTTDQIAKANTDGILALNKLTNVQADIGFTRTAHAHGNLESVLNIVAGLVLCFIAVAKLFKHIISWLFIIGALLHSGSIYLSSFGVSWAFPILQAGIGPWLILAALLLIGIATIIGFRGEIVQD